MTAHDETPPRKAKEDRVKCPASLLLEIKRAMAMHMRQEGNCNWRLVRERPDFAPWIGEAAGEAGRRKFFRWKKQIRSTLPADRTRPYAARGLNDEQQAWAKQEIETAGQAGKLPIRLSPRQVMANGPAVLEGLAQLGQKLALGFDDIARVRRAALMDDPEGHKGQAALEPELLLKAVRAQRELTQTAADFLRHYNGIWALEDFNHDLVGLLEAELASHPELRDHVLGRLVELTNTHGGAPPPGG